MPNKKLKNVVFLDRDGVINRDSSEYVKDWSEFEFLPGSLKALKILAENRFPVIIITNQSAINRKIMPLETLMQIHTNMTAAIKAAGGELLDIFFCPHTPDQKCDCRKPKPGMLQKAQKRYGIDMKSTFFVGDNATDIECALNGGCEMTILVRTGKGIISEKILSQKNIIPTHVADDLFSAVQWIIYERARQK